MRRKTKQLVPGLRLDLIEDETIALFTMDREVDPRHVGRALTRGSRELVFRRCHIILDFTKAEKLDDNTFGMIAFAQGTLRRMRREIAVIPPSDPSVLDRLSLDIRENFPICEDLEEAIASVRGESLVGKAR